MIELRFCSLAQGFQSLSDFAEHLATNVDIVFPVIHGKFGEDGGIQELLEKAKVPFVGTPSKECQHAFDKVRCVVFSRLFLTRYVINLSLFFYLHHATTLVCHHILGSSTLSIIISSIF